MGKLSRYFRSLFVFTLISLPGLELHAAEIMSHLSDYLGTLEKYSENSAYSKASLKDRTNHLLRNAAIEIRWNFNPDMNPDQRKHAREGFWIAQKTWQDALQKLTQDNDLPAFYDDSKTAEQIQEIKSSRPIQAIMGVKFIKFFDSATQAGEMTVSADVNYAMMTLSTHRKEIFGNLARVWRDGFAEVALHELGHFYGLDHSNGRDDIMQPRAAGSMIKKPSADEVKALIDYRERARALRDRATIN